MKVWIKIFSSVFIILLCTFLTTSKNASGDIAPMSLEELTLGADVIIIGSVQAIAPAGGIKSSVSISIEQVIKGAPGPSPITVMIIRMLDEAIFLSGERVLVFLKLTTGEFTVFGQLNGKFTLSNGHVLEAGVFESDFVSQINQILGGG